MVDRTSAPDYKPPLPAPVRTGSAQVAQLVEHATENRSVGGSIPPLGTIELLDIALKSKNIRLYTFRAPYKLQPLCNLMSNSGLISSVRQPANATGAVIAFR